MTTAIERKVTAGSSLPLSWPIQIANGSVADLDIWCALVNTDTKEILATITPTITVGATPDVGTVSANVVFPDTLTARRVTVRLDIDSAAQVDVDADQPMFRVEPAIVQRPTP